MAKKTAKVPDSLLRHEQIMAVIGMVKQFGLFAIVGLTIWGVAYTGIYLPVLVSHGETTTISVLADWALNVHAHVVIAWGAGVGGAAYGVYQKKRRTKERGERDARITELEKQLDPNRTSSGLGPDGLPVKGKEP